MNRYDIEYIVLDFDHTLILLELSPINSIDYHKRFNLGFYEVMQLLIERYDDTEFYE